MIKKLLDNSAFSGTIILTVGTFIASIFSYILQLYMARTLTVEDFGIFTVLLSFSTIIGVFSGAFSTSVVKKVSTLCAKNNFEVLTKLFKGLSVISLLLGVLISLLFYFFRFEAGRFLNISDTHVLISFAVFLSLSFISNLPTAYLQGLLRFKSLAFLSTVLTFLRMLFPVVVVFIGYSLFEVFLGMTAASILTIILGVLLLKKNFNSPDEVCPLNSHYMNMLSLIGPLIFMRVGLTLLNNVDIILVKRFFSGEQAGVYAGLVTVGKILLFGAGSVATVMFPQISAVVAGGTNPREKLKPFLLLQLLLIVAGTAVFALFPELITLILFGEKFLPVVEYLPIFSVFMGFYVLINFFILFFIAIEKYLATVFLILGVILQGVLIWFYHDSISTVVNINVGVTGFVLFLLILYYKLVPYGAAPEILEVSEVELDQLSG